MHDQPTLMSMTSAATACCGLHREGATHGGQPTAGNPAPVHHRRLGAGLSPFWEERERETPQLKKNMVAHDVMCDVMCGRAGGTASGGVREETAETNQSIMPKNRIR